MYMYLCKAYILIYIYVCMYSHVCALADFYLFVGARSCDNDLQLGVLFAC